MGWCTQFDMGMIFIVTYSSQINSLVITLTSVRLLYASGIHEHARWPPFCMPRDCAFTLDDCSRPPYLPPCEGFTWKERNDAAADPMNNALRWVVNLRHMTKFKPAR